MLHPRRMILPQTGTPSCDCVTPRAKPLPGIAASRCCRFRTDGQFFRNAGSVSPRGGAEDRRVISRNLKKQKGLPEAPHPCAFLQHLIFEELPRWLRGGERCSD